MTLAKVALDDDLFIEYFRFKNGKSQNHQLMNKLFSHLKMPFVVDPSQATRCNPDLSSEIKAQFLAGGQPPKTIEKLAEQSLYKIALTSDNTKLDYPFLNVNTPKTELNYSKVCLAKQSRDKLIQHLTSLCKDAKKIVICDNYLPANWKHTEKLFDDILPIKGLDIEFVEVPNQLPRTVRRYTSIKSRVVSKCSQWNWSRGGMNYRSRHDRYLLIESDNSVIEVMLSSGFSYLWDNKKEITCVFRQIT